MSTNISSNFARRITTYMPDKMLLRKAGRPDLVILILCIFFFVTPANMLLAQENAGVYPQMPPAPVNKLDRVEKSAQQQLEDSLKELAKLREEIKDEKIPLGQKLSELEDRLIEVRGEYQKITRLLDSRTLDLTNLRSEIKSRQDERSYILHNLLDPYIRNFETRLHIAEIQRYSKPLETAKLALENDNLSDVEVYQAQAALINTSLERLHDALGGTRFEGSALDSSGLVKPGTFVLIGPVALFRSQDGQSIGTVEQRLGSLEPTVVGFDSQEMTNAADELITTGAGNLPLDPTLGNAHKIEATKQTLLEHIKKGGPVMYPILALAAAALLVALFKWLELAFIRKPSQRRINAMLRAVAVHDDTTAAREASSVGGPTGRMLSVGVEHIKEPPALIEEVMYEKILTAKMKLNRFLPFVAISAAAAPLLGLLGTVTGIINTFKLITVFGSGDVKMLSGGISEALITTEFGLIVAIPSLLLHAFLSRKARAMIARMEKAAIALINQISKTPYKQQDDTAELLAEMPTAVAREVVQHLGYQGRPQFFGMPQYIKNSAGSIMDTRFITIGNTATVSEAVGRIRNANVDIDEDATGIFVVNGQGKYVGDVHINKLLTRPERVRVDSLVNSKNFFVRVDADRNQVQELFSQYNLSTIPVLDHDDQLVGCITADRVNGNGDKKRSVER